MTVPGGAQEAARLKENYQHGARFRRGPRFDENPTYDRYLSLFREFVPPQARVLDVGCGIGQTTFLLRSSGYRALGADLSPRFLAEGRRSFPDLPVSAATVHHLPFRSESFDAVGACAFIEHVPRVHLMWPELARVLRPGGCLVLFGPNMISPFHSLRLMADAALGPRASLHPLGTPGHLLTSVCLSLWKFLVPQERFHYRRPSLEATERGHADGDAIYLANLMDLDRYFRVRGFSILSRTASHSRIGRMLASLAPPLAGGIGFVARKAS